VTAPPRISVVIPVFNLGQYLEEAVQSVLTQTVQDFEILVIDDGSTDPATRQLLESYRPSKTQVFRTANQGLAAARNVGISHARGEFLCALDADDRLAPTYFEKALAAFDADPGLTFVSSWLHTFGDESWLWKQEHCDLVTLLGEDTVHTPALVRLVAVREFGGYDGKMGVMGYEDWALWLALVERGHRGTILQEVLFHYRRRQGSMSEVCARGEGHLTLMRYLFQKHKASYERHLFSVLERRDAEVGRVLAENLAEEQRLALELEPELSRKREERTRLLTRLSRAKQGQRVVALEQSLTSAQSALSDTRRELDRARAEVEALRSSVSWRLTAPGRTAITALRRLKTGRGDD
jgi:glycosyltransferase involved in cell wall biosynthesis